MYLWWKFICEITSSNKLLLLFKRTIKTTYKLRLCPECLQHSRVFIYSYLLPLAAADSFISCVKTYIYTKHTHTDALPQCFMSRPRLSVTLWGKAASQWHSDGSFMPTGERDSLFIHWERTLQLTGLIYYQQTNAEPPINPASCLDKHASGQKRHTKTKTRRCRAAAEEGEGEGNRRRIWLKHWDNIDWGCGQQSAHGQTERRAEATGWETLERQGEGGWRTVVSFMRRDLSHSLTPFRSRLTPTRPSFPRLLISWSGFTTSLWRRKIIKQS